MVKGTDPVVPPVVVTVTLTGPGVAPAGILKLAVSCTALVTVTLLTVTPPPAVTTVPPATKLVPFKVTLIVLPAVPAFGTIEISVGGGGKTVKGIAALVPSGSETVTLAGPSAALVAILNTAVIS